MEDKDITGQLSAKSSLFICIHSVVSSYIFKNSILSLYQGKLVGRNKTNFQHGMRNAFGFSGSETRLTSNLCTI